MLECVIFLERSVIILNQVVLVGKICDEPKMKNHETVLKIAVPRNYKNENGEYDVDYIPCLLCGIVGKQTIEYCHLGDLVGIKGRVKINLNSSMEIVAEKVSYLSCKKVED